MIQDLYENLREFAEYAAGHAADTYFSLYLLTDPAHPENQSQTPAWQIYLKNAINSIEEGLDPVQTKQWKNVRLSDEDPNKDWARIRKRLDKYITSYRPEGKSLALFISPGGEHRFELPVALANTYHFGKPHIQEFLWALDEYQQHLVLLFAEDQTRALLVALGSTGADATVTSDQAWMRKQRKSAHSQNIQSRDDELTRRYIRDIAGEIDKFFLKNTDIERIILGGNMEIANAMLGEIHEAAREKVIAVLPIPIDTPPHEVAQRISDTARHAEREYETALVNDIISSAKARGRGATGDVAVGRAMQRSAVRLLAMPYPADEAFEPLLLDAVRQGSRVEFLHDEPAERAAQAGGILARLYYAIN
jgi:hypothetical protein